MNENILIKNVTPRIRYEADGTNTEFQYPFAIFEDSDIQIYIDDQLQTSGYTVSGAGDSEGGIVTFDTAPAASSIITLLRNLDIERQSYFPEGGVLRSRALNHEFDYLTACLQQIAESLNRTILFPPYVGEGLETVLPLPSPNKAILWDESGTKLVNSDWQIDNLTNIIQEKLEISKEYAEEATESKNEAEEQAAIAAEQAAIATAKAEAVIYTALGNIGDIKWTMRKSVPNGGVWCNGDEFTKAEFPDFYDLLAEGEILGVKSFSEYTAELEANDGNCGFFGLDTTAQKFRVPKLNDVFLRAILGETDVGSYQQDQLQGHQHQINLGSIHGANADTYVRYGDQGQNMKTTTSIVSDGTNGTPRTGAETRPKNIRLRAYVVLYASAAEDSVASISGFVAGLGEKVEKDYSNADYFPASVDLNNLTATGKANIHALRKLDWANRVQILTNNGSTSIEQGYTPPCSGVLQHFTRAAGSRAMGIYKGNTISNDKVLYYFRSDDSSLSFYYGLLEVEGGEPYWLQGNPNSEEICFIPYLGA